MHTMCEIARHLLQMLRQYRKLLRTNTAVVFEVEYLWRGNLLQRYSTGWETIVADSQLASGETEENHKSNQGRQTLRIPTEYLHTAVQPHMYCLLTLILMTVSLRDSSWCAELSASKRISVRTRSFSLNCFFSSSTTSGRASWGSLS